MKKLLLTFLIMCLFFCWYYSHWMYTGINLDKSTKYNIAKIEQKYKSNPINRQEYINQLKNHKNELTGKNYEKINQIIIELSRKTNYIYSNWFLCSLNNIFSITWDDIMTKKWNQILIIGIECINKNNKIEKPNFWFFLKPMNWKYKNLTWTNFIYSNFENLNKSWYFNKDSFFFWLEELISPTFDISKSINKWWKIKWRIMSEINWDINEVSFAISDSEIEQIWSITKKIKKGNWNHYLINKREKIKVEIKKIKESSNKYSSWLANNLYWPYQVLEIIDWDTIKIMSWNNIETIRFIWFDAPETTKSRFWYSQCFANETKDYLTNKISWKSIYLEYDESQWKIDFYKRVLWYVFFSWENLNLDMIKKWYWFEYTYNKNYKYQGDFIQAQDYAKINLLWLRNWNNCLYISIRSSWFINNIEQKDIKPINNTINETKKQYNCSFVKTTCSQMSSCEEAKYYLNQCWVNKLDKNSDWIPCESICK